MMEKNNDDDDGHTSFFLKKILPNFPRCSGDYDSDNDNNEHNRGNGADLCRVEDSSNCRR
jgi:hypothetical protein